MKRKLQKMIALLAILFVPFFLSSQEYGSILNESFEEGIPSTWTQENVSGNVNWVVETGGNYPKGAYFGEKRLIFFSIDELISLPFRCSVNFEIAYNGDVLRFCPKKKETITKWSLSVEMLKIIKEQNLKSA